MVGFYSLFCPGELAMLEHVILGDNIYIGTNKVIIFLPTSKANHTHSAQYITLTSQSMACPIRAFTAYALIHPKWPSQFFIRLSGNPVLMQDIAPILNKLSSFLKLPQQLIKPYSLCIGESSHLYLMGHSLKYIQEKGRWSSQAFKHYICC